MAEPRSTQDAEPAGSETGTQPAEAGQRGRGSGLGTRGAAVVLVLTFAVLGLIFVALEPFAKWVLRLDSVVLLIAGFVTVTLILYLGTIVMTALGMRTPGEALGMPPGSVRALIAMVLILIFAIIGVVVLQQSTVQEVYTSTGITQTQIDAIRAGGGTVLQQDLMSPAPGSSPGDAVYTVKIRPAMTADEHDFALQLLTTVSTLVVAVAGFYFGSRNVDAADRIARAARAPQRPAPELVPAAPDQSRDEDLGDAGTSPEPPPEPGPSEPGAGGAASPAAPGGGAPQVGGDTDGRPSAPEPPAGEGSPALPIETAESLGDEKPK